MERRKNYMTPFWFLLALTVIKLAFFLYLANSLSQSTISRLQLRAIIPSQVLWILVLLAETVAYWYMRKFLYRRFLAKWHIGLWYASIFLWPIFFIGAQLTSAWRSPDEHLQAVEWANSAGSILYWACLIGAHAFFAGVVIEGIKNRKIDQSPGSSEILGSV